MIYKIFLSILCLFVSHNAMSQKQPLKLDTFKDWTSTGYAGISSNGNYAFYTTYVEYSMKFKTIVRSLNSDWLNAYWPIGSEI